MYGSKKTHSKNAKRIPTDIKDKALGERCFKITKKKTKWSPKQGVLIMAVKPKAHMVAVAPRKGYKRKVPVDYHTNRPPRKY